MHDVPQIHRPLRIAWGDELQATIDNNDFAPVCFRLL